MTIEELNKLIDTSNYDDDSLKGDACSLRYSVVEIIAKRCLQVEIKIRRNEFDEASTDAMAIVKFINKHKAYYTEKEYMVGFRYVANCLAIQAHLKEIQKKNESKQVNVSRLKELLQTLNKYQHFGMHHQVGVLAIKQYFAGNLRKGSSHDFQLRIIRNVSVNKNYCRSPTGFNRFYFQLVKLDPENLEWRFCLYSVLKFKRAAGNNFSTPSPEEIDVITEADGKRYAMFDARICLGYAFCLAELLKTKGKMFSAIKYGSKVFNREEDVLQCIRAKVE